MLSNNVINEPPPSLSGVRGGGRILPNNGYKGVERIFLLFLIWLQLFYFFKIVKKVTFFRIYLVFYCYIKKAKSYQLSI